MGFLAIALIFVEIKSTVKVLRVYLFHHHGIYMHGTFSRSYHAIDSHYTTQP